MPPNNNNNNDPPPPSKAQSRLAQLSSHLPPSSTTPTTTPTSPPQEQQQQQKQPQTPHPRPRRRRSSSSSTTQLPPDYSDILSTLSHLRSLAATPNPLNQGYARQKQAGKLWVRERLVRCFDEGSVREVGSVSGNVVWGREGGEGKGTLGKDVVLGFTPSNNVGGFALLKKRKVVFTADDFSIRAGHADGSTYEKTVYLEKLSLTLRLPNIKLIDGSSGGGSVTTIVTSGYSYIPPLPSFTYVIQQLNAGIPNLAAILGPAIGLGAARAVACHFSVMAGDIGSLFAGGPKVVAGATFEEGLTLEELGGPDMHCRNGVIDNLADSEEDAFAQLRLVLSYLPNSGTSLPPTLPCTDPAHRRSESLRSLIPRRVERLYSPRAIIAAVVDRASFFEIGALWGTTAIVGLARLAGRPVGIVANNCHANAGALDAAGSRKITKHLRLCDVMNLPLLQLVDVPGYAVGSAAERSATMRFGVELAAAYYSTTTPLFSVVVRRAFGVAGGAMLDGRDPRMRVAWPSGYWGSLPLEGGIEVGHSAELKRAAREGGEARVKEVYAALEGEYLRLMNPVRTANAFGVEEIVDPADTRRIVCAWLEHVYEELLPVRVAERLSGKLQPRYI